MRHIEEEITHKNSVEQLLREFHFILSSVLDAERGDKDELQDLYNKISYEVKKSHQIMYDEMNEIIKKYELEIDKKINKWGRPDPKIKSACDKMFRKIILAFENNSSREFNFTDVSNADFLIPTKEMFDGILVEYKEGLIYYCGKNKKGCIGLSGYRQVGDFVFKNFH